MLLIYVGVTFFACKMKDPPSSLQFFLKNPILQRETFFLLFCLDIAQEVGHVKEEDRRPHNPFQAEGISLLTKHISAHRYCNTGDGDSKHYSCPNCDIHTTCNLFACARYSISLFQLCLLSSLMAHQTLASKATTNWVHLAMLHSWGCLQSCPALEIKITQPQSGVKAVTREQERYMTRWSWSHQHIYHEMESAGWSPALENMQQKSRKRLSGKAGMEMHRRKKCISS